MDCRQCLQTLRLTKSSLNGINEKIMAKQSLFKQFIFISNYYLFIIKLIFF